MSPYHQPHIVEIKLLCGGIWKQSLPEVGLDEVRREGGVLLMGLVCLQEATPESLPAVFSLHHVRAQ